MADEQVIDLVQYAGENKPVDFTNALDAIMGRKAIEMLATAKQVVAANLFGDSEESEDTEEQITDEDESEADVEDDTEYEETEEETGETDDQSKRT